VEEEKRSLDWGFVFSTLACLFLCGSLFLFVRNNALFAHSGRNLWHIETVVMLLVLAVPCFLMLLQLIRSLRRSTGD
jgi:hypothetical protein